MELLVLDKNILISYDCTNYLYQIGMIVNRKGLEERNCRGDVVFPNVRVHICI